MAKLPPKKGEENSQEWLNTYADMVTLLLTFFVLLFACSNLDETKLQFIYQAFQMRGKYINPIVTEQPKDPSVEQNGGNTDNADNLGGDGNMVQSYEELYQYLAEYIDENQLGDVIAIEEGAAHMTIRFDSAVLFDGDSYMLKDEGKVVLNYFIPALKALNSHIQTATLIGHTSAGSSNISDWFLSTQRANSVIHYMEDHNTLTDNKYRSKGCGNTEPIEPNDTLEGQRKNRRVEMVLLKDELDLTDPDVIKDILEHDFSLPNGFWDPVVPPKPGDIQTLPDGDIDKIIGIIDNKYPSNSDAGSGISGPGPVDGSQFIAPTESADSGSGGEDDGQDAGTKSE